MPRSFASGLAGVVAMTVMTAGLACKDDSAGGKSPGAVQIDGSSTAFLVSEAAAAEYRQNHPARPVNVGISGTAGGLNKLCNGKIHIANASRPINGEERSLCESRKMRFIELPIGFDGIVVSVNPQNDWVEHITVPELLAMWSPRAQNTVTKWSDVNPAWPDRPLHLFGADEKSGTYDYFMEAIGAEATRKDYTPSADDSVIVQAVANDELALGFFGFAYYLENAHRLRAVPIDDGKADNGAGPIAPSAETIRDGTYQPLSRPMFLYTTPEAARSPSVATFLAWYMGNIARIVQSVGYIPLPPATNAEIQQRLDDSIVGSAFPATGSHVGIGTGDLLRKLR